MVKKTIIKLFAVLLTGIFATGVFSSCAKPIAPLPDENTSTAKTMSFTGFSEIKDEYLLGTVLSIPNVFLQTAGGSVEAETELLFPDGTATRSKSVVLDSLGLYKLTFRARFGGTFETSEKEFNVYNELFSVSSNNSSVAYGEHNRDYYTTAVGYTGKSEAFDGFTGLESQTVTGIKVSLADGDTFRFNKPIDFSKNGPFDDVIQICAAPDNPDELDCGEYLIVLTDAYDPTNYVTVSVVTGWGNVYHHPGRAVVKAAPLGATLTALIRDGASDRLFRGDSATGAYGTQITATLFGYQAYPQGKVAFSFDYNSKNKNIVAAGSDYGTVIGIADTKYFGRPFSSFTTGEAFVSVKAAKYQRGKTHANFIITNINGLEGADLSGENGKGTNNRFKNDIKPIIKIPLIDDLKEYDENNLPVAVVNQPYSIFSATSRHILAGELYTDIAVYKDYRTSSPRTVLISDDSDGFTFTPQMVGNYSIVYETNDGAGNKAEPRVLNITAVATAPTITLDVENAARRTNGVIGEQIPVSRPTQVSGGSGGKPRLHIYAEGGGATYNVFDGYFQDITEWTDLHFRAFSAETYTVHYVATDYTGITEKHSYTVTVSRGSIPVFLGKPALPKYFIAGASYLLPEFSAYNYADGSAAEVPTKIWTSDAGYLSERFLGNYKYTLQATEGNVVTVKYIAEATGVAELSFEIPVLGTKVDGNQKLERYFRTDEIAAVSATDHIAFSPTGNEASMDFINPILADSVISFGFANVTTETPHMDIYFTDYIDPSVRLELTLTQNVDGNTVCSINGDTTTLYDISSASFNDGKTFKFVYDNETNQITLDGESQLTVGIVDKKGEAFSGFPSGKVYVSFGFANMAGKLDFRLKSINGEIFNNATRVNEQPKLSTPMIYGKNLVGGEIKIPKALSAGVFDPYTEFTMTVYMPGTEETIARSVDGVLLKDVSPEKEYLIKLEAVGDYVVEYRAVNSGYVANSAKGRPANDVFQIRVADEDSPVIIVDEKEIRSDVQKGKGVYVPQATATDNFDEYVKVHIYIIDPKGSIKLLKTDNDGFIASQTGVYIIRYVAADQSGNMEVRDFKVTVI